MRKVEEESVKVLVVDDQAPFRAAAKRVVALTPGFEVVGEAKSGEEAVEMAAALTPDLVLMDINLPGINGIEAVRRIQAQQPKTLAFLLSTYAIGDLPSDARTCGAVAYIHKEQFAPQLLRALWESRGDPAWPSAS
ncbi:MAG: response regulator transcription factor [Actinobacteria bacterium]|nr:MAG: response regulator transcription factor [Actinomycetota bacterium]